MAFRGTPGRWGCSGPLPICFWYWRPTPWRQWHRCCPSLTEMWWCPWALGFRAAHRCASSSPSCFSSRGFSPMGLSSHPTGVSRGCWQFPWSAYSTGWWWFPAFEWDLYLGGRSSLNPPSECRAQYTLTSDSKFLWLSPWIYAAGRGTPS